MTRKYLHILALTSVAISSEATAGGANSTSSEPPLVIPQASLSGGHDRLRYNIAPAYSERLGWSLGGAVGLLVTDTLAFGAVVEAAEEQQEYIANLGIQLTTSLSVVGTMGLLKSQTQSHANQLGYGVSLKGSYEKGFLDGFELNAYGANARSGDSSLETGDVKGVELLAALRPSTGSHVTLGGGYEWLDWANGDSSKGFTLSAYGSHRLSDLVSLTASGKRSTTENVFGLGAVIDLGDETATTRTVTFDYSHIDGQGLLKDDRKIQVTLNVGLGHGGRRSASAAVSAERAETSGSSAGASIAAARLLNEVMQRPSFLPSQALVRKQQANGFDPEGCIASLSPVPTQGFYDTGYNNPFPLNFDSVNVPDGQYAVYLWKDYSGSSFTYGGLGSVADNDLTMSSAALAAYLVAPEIFSLVDTASCKLVGTWMGA